MSQINHIQIISFLDNSRFVKKLDYNATITEIKNKTPIIKGLAANAALTAQFKIKYQILVVQSKKKITVQKLTILKRNLLIIITTNILLLQN